jgi:hypothetical protein
MWWQVPKEELSKLLVHSIPEGTAEADVHIMLASTSAPDIMRLEGNCGRDKKVLLVFDNPQKANEAFKALQVRHMPAQPGAQLIPKVLLPWLKWLLDNTDFIGPGP